jgi:cysteine-rich repeat protein
MKVVAKFVFHLFFFHSVFSENIRDTTYDYMCNQVNSANYKNVYNMLIGSIQSFPGLKKIGECTKPLNHARVTYRDDLARMIKEYSDAMGPEQSRGPRNPDLALQYDCIYPILFQYDKEKSINLPIILGSTLIFQNKKYLLSKDFLEAEFVVHVDFESSVLNYDVFTKQKTLWTTLKFRKNVDCQYTSSHAMNCDNIFFSLPSSFFENSFEIKQLGLFDKSSGEDLSDSYSFNLKSSSKSRVGKNSQSTFGIVSDGCQLFKLHLKISWSTSKHAVEGSVAAIEKTRKGNNAEPSLPCWKRKVEIVDILPANETFSCKTPYYPNWLKYRYDEVGEKKLRSELLDVSIFQYATGVSNANANMRIGYSEKYIDTLIKCITNKQGMKWSGSHANAPGQCTSCATTYDTSILSKFCNLSIAEERLQECCFQCKTGFQKKTSGSGSRLSCVRECSKNKYFDGAVCRTCPTGQFNSGGTLTTCFSCFQLGQINHKEVANVGCVECPMGQRVNMQARTTCEPCPTNQYVPPGQSICMTCGMDRAYEFDILRNPPCKPCPKGFYGVNDNSFTCRLCGFNEISASEGQFSCTKCPPGKYANENQTICRECPQLPNAYSEYYENGCDKIRCKSGAYRNVRIQNVYSREGCLPCSDFNGNVSDVDFYRSPENCEVLMPCTNVPANAISGGAVYPSTSCEWKCYIGFTKSNNQCVACNSQGFDVTTHEYFNDACEFSCKKYVYKDPNKACNEKCSFMLEEALNKNIFSRISEYPPGYRKPNYELNVCGANEENAPEHEIVFLRKGLWARKTINSNGWCGNSLFNENEECDDGNQLNGDGCSSSCQIEKDKYWDCDRIGMPCEPNCGWNTQVNDVWDISLKGFLLPICSASQRTCSCQNISYHVVRQLPSGKRYEWMKAHLSPCDCYGNPNRVNDYEKCTHENRGCVECPVNYYYHDLRKECVLCGTQCALGFTSYPLETMLTRSLCRNTSQFFFENVYNNSDQQEIEQKMIGCEKCKAVIMDAKYYRQLANCEIECYQDSTGLTVENNAYCTQIRNNQSGACPSKLCLKCETKFGDLASQIGNSGKYLKGCMDISGYEWTDCNPETLPKYATWRPRSSEELSNLEKLKSENECPWECNSGYYKYDEETCVEIIKKYPGQTFSSNPCPKQGDVLVSTKSEDQYSQSFYCRPCPGSPPFVHQVWISRGPNYDVCLSECERGISWRDPEDDSVTDSFINCNLCTERVCEVGEYFYPCSVTKDSSCMSCGSPGNNREFFSNVFCNSRCIAGFATDESGECKSCDIQCGTGFYVSKNCQSEQERIGMPICLPCPPLAPKSKYVSGGKLCEIKCELSDYANITKNISSSNKSSIEWECVLCNKNLCPFGNFGTCNSVKEPNSQIISHTELLCVKCENYDENAIYYSRGSCLSDCKSGFKRSSLSVKCEPIIVEYDYEQELVDLYEDSQGSAPQILNFDYDVPVRKSYHS